jgi:hypothetical protein
LRLEFHESSFRRLKKGNKGAVLQLIEAEDSSEEENSIAVVEMVHNFGFFFLMIFLKVLRIFFKYLLDCHPKEHMIMQLICRQGCSLFLSGLTGTHFTRKQK